MRIYFTYPSHMNNLSRSQELGQAHSWLTIEQRHALIAYQYSFFLEKYSHVSDIQILMDNWIMIATKMPSDWVKDRLAVAAEWSLF